LEESQEKGQDEVGFFQVYQLDLDQSCTLSIQVELFENAGVYQPFSISVKSENIVKTQVEFFL